jgi:hypothetical protein
VRAYAIAVAWVVFGAALYAVEVLRVLGGHVA